MSPYAPAGRPKPNLIVSSAKLPIGAAAADYCPQLAASWPAAATLNLAASRQPPTSTH